MKFEVTHTDFLSRKCCLQNSVHLNNKSPLCLLQVMSFPIWDQYGISIFEMAFTHQGWEKLAAILQTFSNSFSQCCTLLLVSGHRPIQISIVLLLQTSPGHMSYHFCCFNTRNQDTCPIDFSQSGQEVLWVVRKMCNTVFFYENFDILIPWILFCESDWQ